MWLKMKYAYWYGRSHYHYLKLTEKNRECIKIVEDDSKTDTFKKNVREFWYHSIEFDRIQIILDDLKEKLCRKYPKLREEP